MKKLKKVLLIVIKSLFIGVLDLIVLPFKLLVFIYMWFNTYKVFRSTKVANMVVVILFRMWIISNYEAIMGTSYCNYDDINGYMEDILVKAIKEEEN